LTDLVRCFRKHPGRLESSQGRFLEF